MIIGRIAIIILTVYLSFNANTMNNSKVLSVTTLSYTVMLSGLTVTHYRARKC